MKINKVTFIFFICLWASKSTVAVANASVVVIQNLSNIAAKVTNGGSLSNVDGDALFEASSVTLSDAGIGSIQEVISDSDKNIQKQQVRQKPFLSNEDMGNRKEHARQQELKKITTLAVDTPVFNQSELPVLQSIPYHNAGFQVPSLSRGSKGVVKKVLSGHPITEKESNRLLDVNENILKKYGLDKGKLISRAFDQNDNTLSAKISIRRKNEVNALPCQELEMRNDTKQSPSRVTVSVKPERKKQSLLGTGRFVKQSNVGGLVKSLAPVLMSGLSEYTTAKDEEYTTKERSVKSNSPRVFTGFDRGMKHAKKHMEEADIVYLAIGAGKDRDQICPEFLRKAALDGKNVLVVTVDKNGEGIAPKTKNIKHIHINDYIHKGHVETFDSITPRQKLIVFDGTVSTPSSDNRCCDFTKEMITNESHKKNNRVCWVQTLGVVNNKKELQEKSLAADKIGRDFRQLNIGNGHGDYSLNHAAGERRVHQQIKDKLGLAV